MNGSEHIDAGRRHRRNRSIATHAAGMCAAPVRRRRAGAAFHARKSFLWDNFRRSKTQCSGIILRFRDPVQGRAAFRSAFAFAYTVRCVSKPLSLSFKDQDALALLGYMPPQAV